jgi:hypothetical protein
MFETKSNLPVRRFSHSAYADMCFLSYDDIKGMHILDALELRPARWTPPFVWNTRQLQHVLLVRAWRMAFGCKPMPPNVPFAMVDAAATARCLRGRKVIAGSPVHKLAAEAERNTIKRAGSYSARNAAIAWRAWREGQDSVTVAEGLGITPQCVRVLLQKMRETAAELGYETGDDHPSKGKKKRK